MNALKQVIRVGRKRFVLLPEREYERLIRHTPAGGRQDALAFMDQSIGETLRSKRHRAGLSQAEASRRSGLRIETLSRLENGRGNPTVATIRKILAALGEEA